jgi:hypothetical protein
MRLALLFKNLCCSFREAVQRGHVALTLSENGKISLMAKDSEDCDVILTLKQTGDMSKDYQYKV